MKKLFKPYGVAFKAGMVLIALCLIFLLGIVVFYAEAYHITTQKFKDQAANLWAMSFASGFLLTIVGSPTAPSKK